MGATLQLHLPERPTVADVRRLCAGLRRQLASGRVTAVVCRVEGAAADLATVDAVARLALVARRAGVAFRLDPPGPELSGLLRLVGLTAVLTPSLEDR